MDPHPIVIYRAYGLRIDSDLLLPAPVELPAPEGVDVEVRAGVVPTDTVTFVAMPDGRDEDEAWLYHGWCNGRVLLRFPEATAEITVARDRVLVHCLDDDDDYLAHIVLDHVIPRWLALRGELVLHASSVVSPSGHAVAFVGESGRGKSSTATGLAKAGWPLLSDDVCRILPEGGQWQASPGYPGMRLNGTSRVALVPGLPSWPMASGSDKHRVIPDLPARKEPALLGLVVELGYATESPSVHRLSFSEATASLTRHGFHLAASPDTLATQVFAVSSAVAADVPCVRLDFRRTWDVYPEVVGVLESLMATSL